MSLFRFIEDDEWQFLDIPPHEQWAAHVYELARLVPAIRTPSKTWLSLFTPEVLANGADEASRLAFIKENPVFSRFLRYVPGDVIPDLSIPWKKLTSEEKVLWCKAIPQKSDVLEQPWEWLSEHLFYKDSLIEIFKSRIDVTPEVACRLFFEKLGCLVFHVPKGRRTKRAVKRAFEEWLKSDDGSAWCSGEGDLRNTRKREPIEWLRYTAGIRLKYARSGSVRRRSFQSVINDADVYHDTSQSGQKRSDDGWLTMELPDWNHREDELKAYAISLFGSAW